MLSKPVCGWTTIKIKDWSDRASYLTNIHLDLLNSLINSYSEYCQPACIRYDAEGWEGIIVIDDYWTYIISENADSENEEEVKSEVLTIEINRDDLAKELIEDIEQNFNDWCDWQYWQDKEDMLIQKEELSMSLNKLKNIIERRG